MASFGALTVDDVKQDRAAMVIIKSSEHLDAALHILASNQLLSAPVWNAKKGQFVGFVDMFDLIRVLTEEYSEQDIRTGKLHSLAAASAAFRSQLVDSIDVAVRNPFACVPRGTLLDDVLGLCAGDPPTRRVCIRERDGLDGLCGVVSQSALAAMAALHKTVVSEKLGRKTVGELFARQGACRVVSVMADQSVLEAFGRMRKEDVRGVAVVESSGHLVGSLSVRDLKGLMSETGQLQAMRLLWPVRRLIQFVTQDLENDRYPAISVNTSDSFRHLLQLLGAVRVHRIFVVDESNCPTGVISVVDVCRVLAKGDHL